MVLKNHKNVATAIVICSALLAGCSDDGTIETEIEPDATETDPVVGDVVDVNPALFVEGALAEDITIEDCTLTDGTATSCYRITIVGAPNDDSLEGPYCPPSINSTAEEGGTWIKDGEIFDFDGDFVVNLPTFFDDDRWQMYDVDTGLVTIIDGATGCETAGDPENNTGMDNFCLECTLENLDGGVTRTMLIPITPVFEGAANNDFGRNNIGLALNGVLLGPPAPLDLIVSGLTLGVFDDCGGHANPNEGYHYHAANGCSEVGGQDDGHSPMIGYALDGFGIYARMDAEGNVSAELDECGGETDNVRGYHYHASGPGTNEIIGCFMGAQGSEDNTEEGGVDDAGDAGGPDLTDSVAQLNALGYDVTIEQLQEAIGNPPDFIAAAATLNIPYDVLTSVLPAPPGGFPEE